ncbi:MAG: hypothetical protein ACO3NZ_04460 [Pirellulales bacterium]
MPARSVGGSRFTRRELVAASSLAALPWSLTPRSRLVAQEPGERPQQDPAVRVLNPRARVPVSLIIDDSTCLVNLAHFAIPQFAEVFPDRYTQDWRRLPREIPDAFVREFGEWCRDHGVKGKYSVVPCPALVGWVDRDLPGWPKRALVESLSLVRDFMSVDWDIHPEMVTHTWAINTKTGRPYAERTEAFQENWGFSVGKSVDELTDYLAYALRILKNAGLQCEGVTTPGGFGSRVMPQLSRATLESCRDVYGVSLAHYFRNLYTDDRSVRPLVENARDLDGEDPQAVVSVVGCTGDWFGGWDGLEIGTADQFITADLSSGRLPEVIARGEPAVMVCHWPGIYCNGNRDGFRIFQTVVERLHAHYDHLLWMKPSEIARYEAARQLTAIHRDGERVLLSAPFASGRFTLDLPAPQGAGVRGVRVLARDKNAVPVGSSEPDLARQFQLRQVDEQLALDEGTWCHHGDRVIVCLDLPRGASAVEFMT